MLLYTIIGIITILLGFQTYFIASILSVSSGVTGITWPAILMIIIGVVITIGAFIKSVQDANKDNKENQN